MAANLNPSSIFHKKVVFSTVDTSSGNLVSEGYSVSNPSSPGVNVITLAGGTKAVVPLTTSTGEGSPYLKFHFPSGPSANTMYITFCVKSTPMDDGYYDYKTGIPDAYRTSIRNWIKGASSVTTSGVKSKSLKFTAYGTSTNKSQEAITFYVNFQGFFSATSSTSSAPLTISLPS
jgi:hypothetical protein